MSTERTILKTERPVRVQLVQTPEPERHEGAITEPIEGQPLSEPSERESLPPEPASSRPHEESERHEGAITEPEEAQGRGAAPPD
jgi:hypothetical protein